MNAANKTIPRAKKALLALKIAELRSRLGLTQEQFAHEVGVTFSTVNRWENGKGKPSPLAMRRIADLRGVTDEAAKDS